MFNQSEKIQSLATGVIENASMKAYNTFRFDYIAQYLVEANSAEHLCELVNWANDNRLEITLIGGGSNLLIAANISGLVIINRLKGIESTSQEGRVLLRVGAGENWHDLVSYTVAHAWYGIENLALIPGTAGAAPVQNIGAYGVEVKDCLTQVQVLDLTTGKIQWLVAEECGFGYRESHFKGQWKGRYCILAIELALSLQEKYTLEYGGLNERLKDNLSIEALYKTICQIRSEKLPNPAVLANAGSFFKNPIIESEHAQLLKAKFPNIVMFPAGEKVKLAAGWLIDQAGWKGHKFKGVGVYDKQALVMVNYEEQTANALLDLEGQIKHSVLEKFSVTLEREPVMLPHSYIGSV
ncbi:UDP-N-acetylmuramate dehydrogenase [Marinomonas dokdonensis]|uniref:UDP-N-acetylmuramate dehydrogenase n=1 Tax=Marinomonas dokdonensis TaxID=328224 RepID=UPI0040557297